jgi:hypothetical protein
MDIENTDGITIRSSSLTKNTQYGEVSYSAQVDIDPIGANMAGKLNRAYLGNEPIIFDGHVWRIDNIHQGASSTAMGHYRTAMDLQHVSPS